jgi:hypothetical protein
MTIKDTTEGKIICLSSSLDNRGKILNIINFIFFTAAGMALIYLPISERTPFTFGVFVFIAIVSGIYLFAAYRFINKALEREEIILNEKTLTISRKGFLSKKSNVYQRSKISNFRHLDKPNTTKHPLAGNSFDYLGFQTEEQMVNELHGDNRLAFEYDNKTIRFGVNIYSWDFEKLEILFYDIVQNDLEINEKVED